MTTTPRLLSLVAGAAMFVASAAHAQWSNVAPGVDYQEFTGSNYDIHVTRVDLTNDQIRVVSSRESERGLKVSDYAKKTKAIAAINGDYFDPKFNPIGLVIGPCGTWTGSKDTGREGVVAVGNKRASIQRQSEVMDPVPEWVETAVSGWPALVVDCAPIEKLPGSDVFTRAPHPRTAVGVSKDGKTLYMLVADGRRAGIPGLTLPQLATWMATKLNACSAINLDGGGSSAMWVNGKIVNRPSDAVERPVGDHLAVVLRSDYTGCDPQHDIVPMTSATATSATSTQPAKTTTTTTSTTSTQAPTTTTTTTSTSSTTTTTTTSTQGSSTTTAPPTTQKPQAPKTSTQP